MGATEVLLHHILDALKAQDGKIDSLRSDLTAKLATVQQEVQAVREQAATFQCHIEESEAREVKAEEWRVDMDKWRRVVDRIINRREAAALAILGTVCFISSVFGVYVAVQVFGG